MIVELNNFNYSFSHILLSFIKNIVEAKEIYKDEVWFQYDVDDFIRAGLIDSINFDEIGNITVNSILGNFLFSSLLNKYRKNEELDNIVKLNQYQTMCFSNAIDILEEKIEDINNIIKAVREDKRQEGKDYTNANQNREI